MTNKTQTILEDMKGKPLEYIADRFHKLFSETIDEPTGNRISTTNLGRVIAANAPLAAVAIGKVIAEYNPAIMAIELYVIKPNCSYLQLNGFDLPKYYRHPFSNTYFQTDKLTISGGVVLLKGEVRQTIYGQYGGASPGQISETLDRLELVRNVGRAYQSFALLGRKK